MNELGLAIRLARVAVGLTQWQLAAIVESHPTTINLIERGKIIPNSEHVQHIFDALDARVPPTSRLAVLVLREARRAAESTTA